MNTMKMTIASTEEFFRTEEGFLVRLWHGRTETGAPVMAYVAAICIAPDQEALLKESAMVPIPGPEAIVTEVVWQKTELPGWAR
jgi:hypothetical protein